MNNNLLVRLFGWRAAMLHGNVMMLDRWLWLKQRLPVTRSGLGLLDVGCGTGAFTIATAQRGYNSLGLSWDKRNQDVAEQRAALCGAKSASFEVQDVRYLDEREDLVSKWDYIVCLECIEHVLDDVRLMQAMERCLKPGGRLLLTTPNYLYWPISDYESGPFANTENGWHVRRGYSPAMLRDLCAAAGLVVEEISYCSGACSQLVVKIHRPIEKLNAKLAWAATLLLRIIPPLFDRLLNKLSKQPNYSICLEAWKPLREASGSVWKRTAQQAKTATGA